LGEQKISWTVWLTPQAVWERYRTLSQIAILEGSELERVKKEVFEAIEEAEKNEQGEVEIHGVTYLAWTTRV
jgi:hypothetical protein